MGMIGQPPHLLPKSSLKKLGNAFGETVLSFQTPPNRSQMGQALSSDFGNRTDEKITTVVERLGRVTKGYKIHPVVLKSNKRNDSGRLRPLSPVL